MPMRPPEIDNENDSASISLLMYPFVAPSVLEDAPLPVCVQGDP